MMAKQAQQISLKLLRAKTRFTQRAFQGQMRNMAKAVVTFGLLAGALLQLEGGLM